MKKTICLLCALMLIFCTVTAFAEELQSFFNKYEIINTPERIVAGTDASGLIAYVYEDAGVAAYDITEDKKLFVLLGFDLKLAPWYEGTSAVVINSDNEAEGIVSRKGEYIARFPVGYSYAGEFKNGFICLINKNVTENVYNLFDRKGKLIIGDFFAPECELDDGSVIISNMGGGFSKISKKGKVSEFKCAKNVLIEDAVSVHNGVYVSTDGNIYNAHNKLIYENTGGGVISPIDENYALVAMGEDQGRYIINIKEDKKVKISDYNVFDSFVYSGGEVSEGAAFVGNSEKSVLVSMKTGAVISPEVKWYSPFYDGTCAVEFMDGSYGYLNSKGEIISEMFDYASGFENGYAVAINKTSDKTEVFVILRNGEKKEIYSLNPYKELEIFKNKAAFTVVDEKGIENEVTLQKTNEGNLYVGGNMTPGYIFELTGKNTDFSDILMYVVIVCACAYIVILGVKAVKRKKK